MGVFTRPDSRFYWVYLETAPRGARRERTAVRVGSTAAQRHDSRRLALDVYHQRMNELAIGIHRLPRHEPPIRFSAYADIYARDILPHRKGHERDGEILRTLRRGFGDEWLSVIDRERVQTWMTARRGERWRGQAIGACTVNREVDLLKSMLRDAVPKYLTESPIAGMTRLKTVPPRRRVITPREELQLLEQLRADDKAIVLMGLDTLCRLRDILDLKRVDDDGESLYISEPKDPRQAQPYRVPISRRLRAALDAVPENGPYYFPRRRIAATDRDRRNTIRQMLEAACARAGVPYGRAKDGVTFHWATRRTGATRMIQRGVDLKTVQAIGHWKTADVVLGIYAETSPQAARDAVELVGAQVEHDD